MCCKLGKCTRVTSVPLRQLALFKESLIYVHLSNNKANCYWHKHCCCFQSSTAALDSVHTEGF